MRFCWGLGVVGKNKQQKKQVPPLRCGMTNKKNKQRQEPIRRFWLRQNDDALELRSE